MPKASEDLVFVEGKVIGEVRNGVFVQRTALRHIFRQQNAKGIDVNVYHRLAGRCKAWRLEFTDTKQILSIPFEKIAQVGTITSTGAVGAQYLVKMDDFNEDQAAIQSHLFDADQAAIQSHLL